MKLKLSLLIMLPVILYSQASIVGKYSTGLNAWVASGSTGEVKVWVDLTDKGANRLMLSTPELFLSERSINRRMKRGDAINETDLPLWSPYLGEVERNGFRIISKSKWFNSITLSTNREGLVKLAEMPFVKFITPVAKGISSSKDANSDHPYSHGTTSNTSLDYGQSLAQLQPQQIPAAHDMGFNGEGVYVCLMDAGFNNLAHEVFDSLRIVATWDFVNGDPNVGDGGLGSGSHGTSTLSVIAGYKPGKLIGTAYKSSYLLAKTENTESETPAEEDFWIAAAEWADSIGVDVTSTSLVYLEFDPPFTSYTWQDMDGNTARMTKGADLAVGKGILVFNSAGNNGTNDTHNTLAAPADGDSVITIGSITSGGQRSSFSSVGLTVDGRIKPDLMAVGSSTYAAAPGNRTSYTITSGTSLACPIAAGIGAMMLQKKPDLNPVQVREILRNTASMSTNPDRFMGWGIMNAVAALNNIPSSVDSENDVLPESYFVANFPNPFNPSTSLYFSLPTEKYVKISLFNSTGRLIREIVEGTFPAGGSKITITGSDLASGNYFVVLNTGEKILTHKLSLIK